MIAAILRAYWLSTRLGGGRGAVFSVVLGVLWYGLWVAVASGGGVWIAMADRSTVASAVPLGLMMVCLYWQVVPLASATMGAGLDLRKLLHYPVPHGRLFAVELLLRLASGAEMALVLLGGGVGLVANHAWGGRMAVGRIALPVLLFAGFNVLMSSGMRSLVDRIMARRQIREAAALILAMVWALPRLLVRTGALPKSWSGPASALEHSGLPWTSAAAPILGQSWSPLLWLILWTAGGFVFARRQWERTLRYDTAAAQATPSESRSAMAGFAESFYRIPGLFLPDPLAAIAEKELRSLARTPRFRMVFIMGFTFGLMVWFPTLMGRGHSRPSAYFLPTVALYAVTLLGQVTYWNCFGFDRAAAAIYFVTPASIRQALVGKNIAAVLFVYLEVLILTIVTAILRVVSQWSQVVEMFAVVGVCSLYLLALGNLSSVNYPRALLPERAVQGARGGTRIQGLLFLLYPVTLLPVFLAYLARYAFASQLAFVVILAIAGVIGGTLYGISMESAVSGASRRRETIVNELSRY